MPKNTGPYGQLLDNLAIIIDRSQKAWRRMGIDPYDTEYDLVDDRNMSDNLHYVAMPTHYRHWRYGKAASQGDRSGHVFEVVINSDPSVCYLGVTNDLVMQMLVVAHAVGGHVDFFKNNYLFGETMARSVIERFAQNKRFVDRLVENPDWRWQGVEAYLDSAHALEQHVGWLPSVNQLPEREHREQLMTELRELQAAYRLASVTSDKEEIVEQIKHMEARLKCHPLVPSTDILGFLMEPNNTPHLPEEARVLLGIVREQARYFQPQGRTKFMNEGWATYWEEEIMKQPELNLPFKLLFDASRYWTMFDMNPTGWYLDPYALGATVWKFIDRKYGFDDGEETVKFTALDYAEQPDGSTLVVDTGKRRQKKLVKRNRDKMFEIRRTYDDSRFLDEFLKEELFEEINLKALEYVRRTMGQINLILMKKGWGPNVVFEPIPDSLEGMMGVIETWTNLAGNSQYWRQNIGTPEFPVHESTLQNMSMLLQIIGAFDQDKHSARRQLVMRTGYHSVPNISLVDTGRFSDGVWTIRHEFDPTFGPLLQSEARDTLRHFRFLCGAPCRLLTMEFKTDYYGRPSGDPVPYEYYTEDGDTVKERYL